VTYAVDLNAVLTVGLESSRQRPSKSRTSGSPRPSPRAVSRSTWCTPSTMPRSAVGFKLSEGVAVPTNAPRSSSSRIRSRSRPELFGLLLCVQERPLTKPWRAPLRVWTWRIRTVAAEEVVC